MTILLLMISYPDVTSNSSMYSDLANEFAMNGHLVYVAVANGPSKTCFSKEGKINVLRVRTLELFNVSYIKKGLANIILPFQITRAIFKHFGKVKFDAVILPTPPITFLRTIIKIKKKIKPKIYLILRDIFPQNAKDLGIIKDPIIFNFFRKKEKNLYGLADNIGCMSAGNISYILNHNREIDLGKLHLLPNWKNVKPYYNPDLSLRKKYGLENKFIVLYGGNLGKPQQIEFILDLAKVISYIDDVVFLLVGDGTEKKRIAELACNLNLKNIIIKDSLPRLQYQELAKVCDVGLINLDSRFTIPNIPSRTLAYWEAKLPILAAIDKNTDFNTLLEESGSGLWSITGDIKSYRNNLERLYKDADLRKSMGENGYQYLKENCTTAKAFSIIEDKLLL